MRRRIKKGIIIKVIGITLICIGLIVVIICVPAWLLKCVLGCLLIFLGWLILKGWR
ncbi:MAG: hypothetical protein ACFWUE_09165 [Xylanivirga thermophila]|jgi:uncharacterized membrane protein|uniref:hypothetical protein n=1 Tax=Xylanivirga thermophila TaxID=2496273 RepID=UPI0039F49E38